MKKGLGVAGAISVNKKAYFLFSIAIQDED